MLNDSFDCPLPLPTTPHPPPHPHPHPIHLHPHPQYIKGCECMATSRSVLHKLCIRENLLGYSWRLWSLYCFYHREWHEFKGDHVYYIDSTMWINAIQILGNFAVFVQANNK